MMTLFNANENPASISLILGSSCSKKALTAFENTDSQFEAIGSLPITPNGSPAPRDEASECSSASSVSYPSSANKVKNSSEGHSFLSLIIKTVGLLCEAERMRQCLLPP